MSTQAPAARNLTLAYVAPFVVFVVAMGLERAFSLPSAVYYPLRFILVCLVLIVVSRRVIPLRPSAPLASIAIGIAVFLIWIGPDVIFGPAYRHHWIFENAILGQAASSAGSGLRGNVPFIVVRTLSCMITVPILEELFWRGWLLRWLIGHEFTKVPIGAYTVSAFWMVALLFASEHGPYWEVGLAAGLIYNWWLVRTKNLADCIVAHAVTNGALSAYVLLTGNWQYWL